MKKPLTTIIAFAICFSTFAQYFGKSSADSLRYQSELLRKDRLSYYLQNDEIHPDDYNSLFFSGVQKLENNLYEEALSDVKASLSAKIVQTGPIPSLKKNEHKNRSYLYIAVCFEYLQRNDSAVYYLDKALKVDPYFEDAYLEKASIAYREKNIGEAIDIIIAGYEAISSSKRLLVNLAAIYIENGQVRKAKRLLKSSEKEFGGYADPYIILSQISLGERKYDLADQYLDKALSIDSLSLNALMMKAAFAIIKGETAWAKHYLTKSYRIDSTIANVNYALGVMEITNGEFKTGLRKMSDGLRQSVNERNNHLESDPYTLELADLQKAISELDENSEELEQLGKTFRAELEGETSKMVRMTENYILKVSRHRD